MEQSAGVHDGVLSDESCVYVGATVSIVSKSCGHQWQRLLEFSRKQSTGTHGHSFMADTSSLALFLVPRVLRCLRYAGL